MIKNIIINTIEIISEKAENMYHSKFFWPVLMSISICGNSIVELSLEDLLIAARTVYGEARGESYIGKKAVAHVLINRTENPRFTFDHSLAASALRKYQFSCWNLNDPNRKLLFQLNAADAGLRACLRAVLEALDEKDFTNGATHYYVASMPHPPPWGQGKTPIYQEGKHVFFALSG